jgi:hypothetical protein
VANLSAFRWLLSQVDEPGRGESDTDPEIVDGHRRRPDNAAAAFANGGFGGRAPSLGQRRLMSDLDNVAELVNTNDTPKW